MAVVVRFHTQCHCLDTVIHNYIPSTTHPIIHPQAVLTVDNYLHLFDLPGHKTITATTPIEEVRRYFMYIYRRS